MNNLHINLNEFTNASRVLKQTKSLVDSDIFDKVYIAALHKEGLEKSFVYEDGRELKRFSLNSRNLSKKLLFQLIKYIEFCFKVYFFYKNKNIKIVNIHILSLLPLGVFLKYAYNAKLIYDTHELETETNGAKGLRKKISKWIERKLIKHVDTTFVVSESIADWYSKEYGINRPPVILNVPKKRDLKTNNYFRKELSIREDQIIFLYQGGLGLGRGINLILEAFKFRNDDKVVIVFMGYGQLEKNIKLAATSHTNIFFYPAVSPDIVLEYTASADVGVSLIENSCLSYYYCMPNKLFEYAMTGLPVLVSNTKDMSELVNQNKMGGVINDFSVAGINHAIDNFLTQNLDDMKMHAYSVACDKSWEIQEEKMINVYRNIINLNS